MTQKAYIAGKITGVKDLNIRKFKEAEKLLRKHGYQPINPHFICSDIHPQAAWETFMKRCLPYVIACDCVITLDDWYQSKGATMEVETAFNLKIPVLEIETMEPLDLQPKVISVFNGAILNIRL